MKQNKPSTSRESVRKNQNYFHPLQTIEVEESEEIIVTKEDKIVIPPLTILKATTNQILDICKTTKINDYAIKKISIGHKLFCKTQTDQDKIINQLGEKFEFFSYTPKHEKPYKALLLGMDKTEPMVIKSKLINLGLECLSVKLVHRTDANKRERIIYIVYFKRKSITLRELKDKFCNIDYLRVRWEYTRVNKNKITQCFNCQMFGHGSSRCKVKTFCANCAGNHLTAECNVEQPKCSNCNGPHKAMSASCPSRQKYMEMKQRFSSPKLQVRHQEERTTRNYSSQYPNILNQEIKQAHWVQRRAPQSNDLFSLDEIKSLTIELITNLQQCITKADQFEVITSLACKFLSK